ncbi:TPA: hypothetical protein ACIN81_000993 [Streptococcus agalactiae]
MKQLNQQFNIGFYEGFYHTIPEPILSEGILELSLEGIVIETDEKLKTLIMAKSLLKMTPRNYKLVSPYLFTYKLTNGNRPLVQTVDDSIESFTQIKQWALNVIKELSYG